MELNLENREKLRKKVEEMLQILPDNMKMELNSEILESILFETYEYSKGVIKLPVWSGEFLKKLDLSKVDFTNVSWNIIGWYRWCGNIRDITDKYFIKTESDEKIANQIEEDLNEIFKKNRKITCCDFDDFYKLDDYSVCYAGTNAKIDFSKSFEYLMELNSKEKHNLPGVIISDCDFSGYDFSDYTINLLSFTANHCNFSNSKLFNIIRKSLNRDYGYIIGYFWNKCNFENVDLSKVIIPSKNFELSATDLMSNFKNTAVEIGLEQEQIDYILDLEKISNEISFYKILKEKWLGSYLNGFFITNEDNDSKSSTQLLVGKTSESIKKQLKKLGRKK